METYPIHEMVRIAFPGRHFSESDIQFYISGSGAENTNEKFGPKLRREGVKTDLDVVGFINTSQQELKNTFGGWDDASERFLKRFTVNYVDEFWAVEQPNHEQIFERKWWKSEEFNQMNIPAISWKLSFQITPAEGCKYTKFDVSLFCNFNEYKMNQFWNDSQEIAMVYFLTF